MGALLESVKKAQQLVQTKTAEVQKELNETEFEGFSSDETVRAVFNGNQKPLKVDITEEGYSQGVEKLELLLQEAMLEAHEKSVEGMKERMQGLARELGLPNMPGGGAPGGM